MRELRNSVWAGLAVALLCAVPTSGFAQVPGQTISQAPAPASIPNGIKLGEARLHPFFDAELRFDSAAGFFPAPGSTALVLQPEFLAHFRPGLRLDLNSDTVAIDLSGNVDYVFYTGILVPGSQAASRLEGTADLNVGFNRKGNVGFELGDHFNRSDRTNNPALGVGVISLYNEARAMLPIRPGGGALEITPKVAVGLEFFDPISGLPIAGCGGDPTCNPALVRTMNYYNLRPGVEARWRFLPKTAVILDATLDSREYFDVGANPPALLLKGSVGIAGLLTSKVSVIAKLGWGYDFAGSGANTLIAHAEASYLINEVSLIKGGYLRNLEPVPAFGTYGDDRGYLEARWFLLGRLTLHGYLAFDYLTYYANGQASGRNDIAFTIDVGPQVQITPWFLVGAGYVLGARTSDGTTAESVNFTRNEGYLRVTFTY